MSGFRPMVGDELLCFINEHCRNPDLHGKFQQMEATCGHEWFTGSGFTGIEHTTIPHRNQSHEHVVFLLSEVAMKREGHAGYARRFTSTWFRKVLKSF